MTRKEFNAAAAECAARPRTEQERRQIRQRFCTPTMYCGYHAALNASVTLDEGQEMIARFMKESE